MNHLDRMGTTLVELTVVLVILGVLYGIGALSLASLRASPEQVRLQRFEHARRQALRLGSPVAVAANDSGALVRYLPDGRALGPGVDPLTGRIVSHAR